MTAPRDIALLAPEAPAANPMTLEAFIDAIHDAARAPGMRNVEVRANASGVRFTATYSDYPFDLSTSAPFERWTEEQKQGWIKLVGSWCRDWRQGRRG
jgi:hypothetical protein